MAAAEGRLSRWSRLKQKGGATEREEQDVTEQQVQKEAAVSEADLLSAKLPGGVQVRNFVPAMPPLAPEPEDDDDRLTRGIGHIIEDEDIEPSEEEPTKAKGDTAAEEQDTLFEGIEETELTDDEKEVVAGLPPLESLNQDSDFTPFFKDGVPEFLKRKAMRILWRSNPLFGFRDGLNDYDEDFNVVHKIIEETVGAYKVGRGHLSDEELQEMMPEQARRAFDEDSEEEEAEAAATSEESDLDDSENEVVAAQSEVADDDENVDDLGDGDDDPDV